MIPWWGWTLIWVGLVLALLVTVALLGWWLFRKAMRLLDDVSDLAALADDLGAGELELPRQQIAVLADLADIRRREDARREHRAARKRDRHDRRMARAERIATVDVSRSQWPPDWYG